MRIFRSFPVQMPSFDVVDGGGGGGAASGGAGGGGFQPSSQSANPHNAGNIGSQGASSPVSLADDTQIVHEGKTMTWKDYRTNNFVPKSEYDNVRQMTRKEIEQNLRNLAQTLQQKPQQQQPRQQPVDPFASVRGLPIVSGEDVAKLAEAGFGQVGQTLQAQQQALQQMAAQIKKLSGGVGTLAKERSGQERTTRISQALSSLGEGYDLKDPFLNEIAQDVLDAWEFEKPEEFPAMVQQRIAAAEKFFKGRQKAQLEAAKTRKFVRPGGGSSPSGAARFDPRTGPSQIADALFGARTNAHAT